MERLFVECAVRAALIAVVTAVVLLTIGIKSAAARHAAWTSVMLTMLLLPIWTAWGPKTPVRLLPPLEWHGSIETPLQNVLPHSVRLTEMRPVKPSRPHPTGQNWTWHSLLLIVYGFGAVGLLARLAIGTARTNRLRSRANVRDGKGISSECTCPITVGWLHPVVILPKNWQEWPPQQLDAVLTHEREHVRRRDPLIQWLALVNRALFWFHPLSWWLERKLVVLAEEACDAAVLAHGHTPQDYSEYLLDIARSVSRSGSRLGIVGMAMPGSLLRQRIPQILNSCGTLPISRSKIAVAVAVCATSSALLASGTLDHARAHVQPGTNGMVHSSVLQTAGTQPATVPPADHARGNPRVLLAQAAAPLSQKAGTAPPSDSAEKERQLEDAFLRSDPITDMTIAMEINYFQLNRAEYFVPLTVKIPGSELVLARNGGAEQTSFDFVGQVKDEFGTVVQNTREKVSFNLNGAAATQLASTPVEYNTGVTLLPGRYSIKLLARDNETGRIGTYETAFTVPNLNKEEQGIPISSVVLGDERVEMTDAINAGNKMQAANPLVADGRKLIPSVTRVFSKSREMYVYLQAYQREAGNTQPLVAFATFYQGQVKALETAPIEVTQGMDSRSKAVPLSLSISLADLKPGEYTCQVTVRSSITQKTALWQAPIVIEP
ncbi:MAG TPA: M56 family metallopeptidase [Bryobacteraceae bacterium]|nr:M56 family metallopeptidase [Bryobacteraceae bacterium]